MELSNARGLKIVLEELNKLKNLIQDTHNFIQRAREFLLRKERPTFSELMSLDQEGTKLNIFCIEFEVIKRKSDYVNHWKQMANNVIDSMMILRLEQLKVVKPQELIVEAKTYDRKQPPPVSVQELELEAQADEDRDREDISRPTTTVVPVDPTAPTKRKRKQNPLYNNEDITLLTEDMYSPKLKKQRRKNQNDANPRRTKAESRKQNKN